MLKMALTRFEWVITTPLGTPVLPLVYMMIAVSDGSGGDSPCAEEEPVDRTEENLWKLTVSVFSGKGSALWLKNAIVICNSCFQFLIFYGIDKIPRNDDHVFDRRCFWKNGQKSR